MFDTQVAAAFLGYGLTIGYAKLVKELLDVELDKSNQFTDWSRSSRPSKSTTLSTTCATCRASRRFFKRSFSAAGGSIGRSRASPLGEHRGAHQSGSRGACIGRSTDSPSSATSSSDGFGSSRCGETPSPNRRIVAPRAS